ncbi:MAG: cupin domain-containing protein [Candidatus Omnitrophica bacterium]|nr:cupin domain-containing protein [Candidatus Omnitrophota bacterium]
MKEVFSMALKGNKRFLRLFGNSGKSKGMVSGLVSLKPKESIGCHNTLGKEEALIILKGLAQVSYGKKSTIKVKAQSFVYIPPETDHDVRNIGKSILCYVYLTASL